MVPDKSINGSGDDNLYSDRETLLNMLRACVEALSRTYPHPRDYVNKDQERKAAVVEYNCRKQALEGFIADLYAELEALSDRMVST